MGATRAGRELVNFELSVLNQHRVTRRHVVDVFLFEAEIGQRDALTGRREQGTVEGIAQRADAERIARDRHFALSIEEHQIPRTVKPLAENGEDFHETRQAVS